LETATITISYPMADAEIPAPPPRPSADVYAIYGVEPEIQAYAMAKYSRSSLSMKESLREISSQRAERFLNTFYFQYGHRSIADLAHIAFALERLSLLAAIAVADEQRWDGQERSTRYQDFSHPDYYIPEFGGGDIGKNVRGHYVSTIEFLFGEYRELSAAMFEHLRAQTQCPATMKPEQYERTLRARAFDIARYMLPLATHTSLGQIVNARTLETQISRLLSSPTPELRELGEKLKEAARTAAYDANAKAKRELYEDIEERDPLWAKDVHDLLMNEVRPAPTLVKYAEANPYLTESRKELEAAARELMAGAAIATTAAVELLDDDPVEIELAATLLYEHCRHPYRQIRERVEDLSAERRNEIVALGTERRGKHDELLRAFCSGSRFRFDILMDIGGFRDMHRHRRCIQIGQDFTTAHGFDVPADVGNAGWRERYETAMDVAAKAVREEANADAGAALYMIPLAYRKRTLFKMDFAEVVYISELRTTPAGHFSYRKIAWEMYQAVARRHPALAKLFRVQDPNASWDLLQR
jgi:thymidylate synthase ThyX